MTNKTNANICMGLAMALNPIGLIILMIGIFKTVNNKNLLTYLGFLLIIISNILAITALFLNNNAGFTTIKTLIYIIYGIILFMFLKAGCQSNNKISLFLVSLLLELTIVDLAVAYY